MRKKKHTFRNCCIEDASLTLKDGSCTVYLSTCGKNDDKVYIKADLNESAADFEDDFVRKLQKTVRKVKESREMEERYMLLEELLKTERNEGRLEGKIEDILDLLEYLGELPDELKLMIENETSISRLNAWLKAAARAKSIDQFREEIQ